MVHVIRDLWIINESGIVLFDRIFDQQLIPDLFGGFMSAIMNLTKEMSSNEELKSFKLIDTQYIIVKARDLFFIGNSASNVKEKKLINELKIISEKFFSRYSETLKEYHGRVSVFKGFIKDIDDSLETPIDRIQKTLW